MKKPYYLSPVEIELLQDYLSCPSDEFDLSDMKSALYGSTSVFILGSEGSETAYVPRHVRSEDALSCLSVELEGAVHFRKSAIGGQDIPALCERLDNLETQYDAFAERMLHLLHGAEIVQISYAGIGCES